MLPALSCLDIFVFRYLSLPKVSGVVIIVMCFPYRRSSGQIVGFGAYVWASGLVDFEMSCHRAVRTEMTSTTIPVACMCLDEVRHRAWHRTSTGF